MTDHPHFYGDGYEPPHAFVDVAGVAPTLTEAAFDEIVAAVSSTPEARMSTYAQPEPESLLDRLKRLHPATPGHGTPADFGALANLVHMSDTTGTHPIAIGGHLLGLTTGNVERMLLDAKAVWYALPEIIEAFELLMEAEDEEFQLALNHEYASRVRALLSKVSGQ